LCLTSADCATNASGATACGIPELDGVAVAGSQGACVNPSLCGIETTYGGSTATMTCDAKKVAATVAAAAVAVYMAF